MMSLLEKVSSINFGGSGTATLSPQTFAGRRIHSRRYKLFFPLRPIDTQAFVAGLE